MDLYNRYGDAGEEYFLAISDAYSDPQKDDPVKVYRSFAGKPYSTSPGVLINAAKQAGLSINPRSGDVAHSMAEAGRSTPSTPITPNISDEGMTDDEEEMGEPLPVFPDEVYEDLPEPLMSVAEHGRNPYDKMLLTMSAITAISATMAPNVSFRYQKTYRPNLQQFNIGGPASGKGRTTLVQRLVAPIHHEMTEQSQLLKEQYKSALAKWKKQGKDQQGDPPKEPRFRLLCFPVNTTLPALDWHIADNDGCGLMFTADGGNLMTAIGNEWGNYVNDLLASAENEGISRSRKSEREFVEVKEARFAVLIASTWTQIRKLFGDGTDGLASRQVFLNMPTSKLWESQWGDDDEESDEEAFDQMGESYKQLYDHLRQYASIRFMLTAEQKAQFDQLFSQRAQTYVGIYGTAFLPSVRRMAVTALRIMCIITILRQLHEQITLPLRIYCSDSDFQRVMSMVDILLIHAGYRCNYLSTIASVRTKNQPMMLVYQSLPDKFKRSQAVEIGKHIGKAASRIDKYLARLTNNGLIRKVEQGLYEKVHTDS